MKPADLTDEMIREVLLNATRCPVVGDFGHIHGGPSHARLPCACGRPFPHAGHVVTDDELTRNATIQLAQRALSGDCRARRFLARAINARGDR